MQVTNVRVSFLREKQPVQFEKAAPAVEFVANLDDGEDHVTAARQLMLDATGVVYAGIGYAIPVKIVKALAQGEVPAEIAVAAETKKTTSEAPPAASEAEPAKKKRGRPAGSKNTLPKAGTKAAEAHATEGAKATAEAKASDGLPPEDDGVPGDDDKPQISTNPEDRVNPDDLPPEDDAAPEEKTDTTSPTEAPSGGADEEFDAKALHTMIHKAITEKKLSVPNAKQVLAHFKVARAQDLNPEQVVESKAMVEKMIAASAQ